MLDCILINRVSSATQVDGFSLAAQNKKGREYIEKCGYKLIRDFTYQESGSSKNETKNYNELKGFIEDYIKRTGKELQVIVEKDDRLGRTHDRTQPIQNLARNGFIALHFYLTNKVLNKNSPLEDFFMQDLNTSMDKLKALNIGREAKKGMKEKASQGWLPHKPPIGYLNNSDRNSDQAIIVNEFERALIERVFSLRGNEGASYAVIADKVREEELVPSHRIRTFKKRTVEEILKNKFYIGRFVFGGIEYEGNHEPIINKALYLKVLKSFESPLTLSKRKLRGLFAGFLKCSECGCQITYNEKIKPSGNIYRLYACANGKKIHSTLVGMYATEEKIMEQFSKAFDDINITHNLADRISKALNEEAVQSSSKFKNMTESLMVKIDGIDKLNVKAYEDLNKGLITEKTFMDLKNKNEVQRLEAQQTIENLKSENSSRKHETAESTLELAKNAKTLWNSLTPHERVDLLKMVLQNQKLRALTIEYELKKPFKILGKLKGCLNNEEWGRLTNSATQNCYPICIVTYCYYCSHLKYTEREFLVNEYMSNGKSASQIARENDCSHSSILKYLDVFGISIRDNNSSEYRTGEMAYGKKIVKGKVVDDKGEQAIIRKMKLLKVAGNSYWKIAEVLNRNRVPTKKEKSIWSAKTVHQIICKKL